MLLAVDIGNTNIVFGVHTQDQWLHHWRIQTVRDRMPDEYAALFRDLLGEADLDLTGFKSAIISSVVPPLTQGFREMIALRTGRTPLILDAGTKTGIEIRTERPEEVGSDLIANAVAAYDRFKTNCVAVDFGTATTFTAIAEPGALMGVSISAGLQAIVDALVGHTSQLPQIELAPPPSVIGRNTVHSMQSGLVLGYVSLIEGLIDRIRRELGHAKVIATGGLAQTVAPLTDRFNAVDPWLTLEGLRLVSERHARGGRRQIR